MTLGTENSISSIPSFSS